MSDETPRRRRADYEPPPGPFDTPSQQTSAWLIRIENDIDFKHRQNTKRIDDLYERVGAMREELTENSKVTYRVEKNTEWLVDMTKGSKAFGHLAAWLAVVLGGVAGALALLIPYFQRN